MISTSLVLGEGTNLGYCVLALVEFLLINDLVCPIACKVPDCFQGLWLNCSRFLRKYFSSRSDRVGFCNPYL